jgi:hypothetical protein
MKVYVAIKESDNSIIDLYNSRESLELAMDFEYDFPPTEYRTEEYIVGDKV